MDKHPITPKYLKVFLTGVRRISGWGAIISGMVFVLGILFLVLFRMGGEKFGPLNDMAVILQYGLTMPIAVYFFRLGRSVVNRVFHMLVVGIGILGMIMMVGLQIARVWEWIPFHQQILLVIVAFLTVLIWIFFIQSIGRSMGFFLPWGVGGSPGRIVHWLSDMGVWRWKKVIMGFSKRLFTQSGRMVRGAFKTTIDSQGNRYPSTLTKKYPRTLKTVRF